MPSVTKRTLRRIADSLTLLVAGTKPSVHDVNEADIALAEVRQALELKAHIRARRAFKADQREEKREEFASIRETAQSRSKGYCECGCGRRAHDPDHFFGGANKQSMESVQGIWMLNRRCHQEKGENRPSAAHWLILFIAHCEKYGYSEMAIIAGGRLQRVRAHQQMRGG